MVTSGIWLPALDSAAAVPSAQLTSAARSPSPAWLWAPRPKGACEQQPGALEEQRQASGLSSGAGVGLGEPGALRRATGCVGLVFVWSQTRVWP